MFSTDFHKSSNTKFHENPLSGSHYDTRRNTDERRNGPKKRVIDALRENANAPQAD